MSTIYNVYKMMYLGVRAQILIYQSQTMEIHYTSDEFLEECMHS